MMTNPHNILISLPYNLTRTEVCIDRASVGETMDRGMDFIVDHISWEDEETMELIFRSTVVLKQITGRPLGECLSTALIWLRE